MSDIVDRAQELEAANLDDALDRQRRAAELEAQGAAMCADCQEPIPEERRRALPSAIRCISCQAWAERIDRVNNNTKGKTP